MSTPEQALDSILNYIGGYESFRGNAQLVQYIEDTADSSGSGAAAKEKMLYTQLKERDERVRSIEVENAALKATLGRVKAFIDNAIQPSYTQQATCFDQCDSVEDGYCIELYNNGVDRLREILSTTPEVLAVVEGYHNINSRWTHDGYLSIWETQYGRAGRPVTVIVLASEKGE